MPKRIKIDQKSLLNMIEDDVEQKDLMEKFGFKTANQLKMAYINALIDLGKVKAIKKPSKGTSNKIPSRATVGKRGVLVIPKTLVREMGYIEGSRFDVEKTQDGIMLTRKY